MTLAVERDWLLSGASAGIALASVLVARDLARTTRLPRPMFGRSGLERGYALEETFGFALIEPLTAFVAALMARLPLARARARTELRLLRAGSYFGLCADELFALSLLALFATGSLVALGTNWLHASPALALPSAFLGAALPFERVRARTKQRNRRIARQLPPTIDLLALCMNAGLDFVGALELVVRELREERDPLRLECRQLLSELAMGHVRAQALANLAERVQAPAIQEFTAAVIQAEQAGTPLIEVLLVQARMLRMRRSVAAEEAAARASVLLVLPMMMLLAAIVLVMLGPFIVNGGGL